MSVLIQFRTKVDIDEQEYCLTECPYNQRFDFRRHEYYEPSIINGNKFVRMVGTMSCTSCKSHISQRKHLVRCKYAEGTDIK